MWYDIFNKALQSDNGEFFRRANESKVGFILDYLKQRNSLISFHSYPKTLRVMHEYGFRVPHNNVIQSFYYIQNTNDIHSFLKYYQNSINI